MGGTVRVEVHEGLAGLDACVGALQDLSERVGAPVTARPRWLTTWARFHPEWDPWVLVVQGPDGAPVAAAPLARQRRRGLVHVVALGHGTSDILALPADEGSADLLAASLVQQLVTAGPWHLELRQLGNRDAVARALADHVPSSARLPGLPSPTTRFAHSRVIQDHTSRNYRSQARHKWNRLQRELGQVEVSRCRDPADVARWLPEVERVCRKRDREIAGRSRHDDRRYAAFFRALLLTHARADELELAVLHAGEQVLAYSVAFLDGSAYRQWNKHFDSAWEAYRPGHVLDARLLEAVLADEQYAELDWMAGDEPYKRRTATDVVETVVLHAGAGRGRYVVRAKALRHRVREQIRRRPRLEEAVGRAKRIGRSVWAPRRRGWDGSVEFECVDRVGQPATDEVSLPPHADATQGASSRGRGE